MSIFKSYCDGLKSRKLPNPYKDEREFNIAYGINTEVIVPLLILPRRDTQKVTATFENYKKVTAPKKTKAVKEPRVVMTKEEARLKRNERQRERMAMIRPTPKPKKTLTDEQRKEYKRNYMKKYREAGFYDQSAANKRWREANPEKNREQRRLESARRRARLKEAKAKI